VSTFASSLKSTRRAGKRESFPTSSSRRSRCAFVSAGAFFRGPYLNPVAFTSRCRVREDTVNSPLCLSATAPEYLSRRSSRSFIFFLAFVRRALIAALKVDFLPQRRSLNLPFSMRSFLRNTRVTDQGVAHSLGDLALVHAFP
jgi:hypothetical protein